MNKNDSILMPSQEDFKKAASQHEDIPSFSEWTQKQLAEAEKKKIDQNATNDKFMKPRGKFRNKNYASPDCGAKIVASNPESLSSSSVLSSLKDEYMLNYCTNRIWFIVELCEAIQAKQLDLANFELFSSSPKHFSVFVSHRFPTREWSNVGKFTAQDSRDVQTFNLHPHFFGKFVKVEMHSHYGREQFCPISWVGIYGTSEYEVLAKEDERNLLAEDDDVDPYDEEIFLSHKQDTPKNLFSSATDAVLSIVKKATAPFMKSEINETEAKNFLNTVTSKKDLCVSPRYIIVCNNCSQNFYDAVYHVISCESSNLEQLISNSFIKHTLVHSESCIKFGLDFSNLRKGAPFPSNFIRTSEQGVKYLSAMLKNTCVAALCNFLAVSENKVVMNTTVEGIHSLTNLTQNKEYCEEVKSTNSQLSSSSSTFHCEGECLHSTPSEFQYSTPVVAEISKSSESFIHIDPSKTLKEDEVSKVSSNPYLDQSVNILEEKSTELSQDEYISSSALPTQPTEKTNADSTNAEEKEGKISLVGGKSEIEKNIEPQNKSSNMLNQDTTLDSIISDINAIEKVVNSPSSSFASSSTNLPTESIFLRLANRIKNLEINMSLSSTYLEELSRRYRMQLELISKTLNLTIQKVEERSKLEEEKDRRREKEILLIRMQLANLTRDVSTFIRDKNSWGPQASSFSQHLFFISIEIFLIWMVFSYWKRPFDSAIERSETTKKMNKKCKRRKSLEGVKGHETTRKKTRRPSEEALDIALASSYEREPMKMDKKRKRRKKDSKCSLNSVHLKRKESEVEISEMEPSLTVEKYNSNSYTNEIKTESIPYNAPTEESVHLYDKLSTDSWNPKLSSDHCNSMEKPWQGLSPNFIKTALAARNSRLRLGSDKESSQELNSDQELTKKETQKERKGSNSLKKYMKKFF